ncbi:MAG: hypothetical protein LPJ91_01900 [Pseudazoarcus pumilus]|nr:hypothetical protein [Pseudazoarcus pumilus]
MNDFVQPQRMHEAFGDDFVLDLSTLRGIGCIRDFAQRSAWLMISVKNPAFSNRLVDGFCRLVGEIGFRQGFVTIVDTPYMANILANRHDPVQAEAEVVKLQRISAEQQARCRKVLRRHSACCIALRSWAELDQGMPQWLRAEVQAAFQAPTRFRADLLARTRLVVPEAVPDERLPQFAQFLVEELPVLLGLYYLEPDSIVDVYPGENLALVWNVERGLYADELPGITALARASDGLAYVDFRERAKAGLA